VSVPLTLAPGESALLVQDAGVAAGPRAQRATAVAATLPPTGWNLSVRGHGPKAAVVQRDLGQVSLGDWREMDALARFAGEGEYRRTLQVTPAWLSSGQRVILDLGEVHDMATVSVNGQALPAAITGPFEVDITSALKPGANALSITIANTPNNAMIDPQAPGFKALKPVAAGLVGPVRLLLRPAPASVGS
jgi:hypothetical protein